MAHPNFYAWATSVRVAMATDPCRWFFHDQIQTHGFAFLDDYLDNILTGPKQDLIIELVKTPGRKKAKAATSDTTSTRLRGLAISSLEDDDDFPKENVLPAKIFQESHMPTANDHNQNPFSGKHGHPLLPYNKMRDEGQRTNAEQDLVAGGYTTPYSTEPLRDRKQPELVPSQSQEHVDLSVIEEDDEIVDQSRTSLRQTAVAQPPSTSSSKPLSQERTNATERPSHLETTKQTLHLSRAPQPPHSDTRLNHDDNIATSHIALATHSENHTAPIPERPKESLAIHANDAMTAPLPAHRPIDNSPQNFDVPLNDEPLPSSPKGLSHKASASFIPALPAPLPLRKSMRMPREPSMGTGLATVGNGAAPGGKRSSWLIKAREAKAMEDTGRKGSGNAVPSLKRKSDEMTGVDPAIAHPGEDERRPKVAKLVDGDAHSKPVPREARPEHEHDPNHHPERRALPRPPPSPPRQHQPLAQGQVTPVYDHEAGVLERLKKTVEGLGSRVGKSMGKSLGGMAAATWLAEAKAAAEVRVTEREKNSPEDRMSQNTEQVSSGRETTAGSRGNSGEQSRLSVSDLMTSKEQPKVFQDPPSLSQVFTAKAKESTSTTPRNSPAGTISNLPPIPVFSKPPPAFVPPPPTRPASTAQDQEFKFPDPPKFSIPPSVPLSNQSSLESYQPDRLFDVHGDVPAWQPTTQDTEYSSAFTSQPGQFQRPDSLDDDDDDSWPLEERLQGAPMWPFGMGAADDSYTWSTSTSGRTDTGRIDDTRIRNLDVLPEPHPEPSPIAPPVEVAEVEDDDKDPERDESDLDEIGNVGVPAVNSVEPKTLSQSESQRSIASSASSNAGILAQAGKLVSSVLGNGKKGKTEVKSLQLAALAAKKQQEEMDKKAVRLKEMENRRQLALQRKADEERNRVLEEERKIKEEGERRKREREEYTEKRLVKGPAKKEEDGVKKRKVVVEVEKKTFSKIAKPGPTPKPASVVKQTAPSSSTVDNVARSNVAPPSVSKTVANGKAKASALLPDEDMLVPSQMVQSQMAARVKMQMQAAKEGAVPPEVPSESIELPDINSEYSNSEDEDRPRAFEPPEWAQSPELRQALETQSTVNPDEIFGAVKPLKMEEMFRARTSRFRARTSSANWFGADRLTAEEEREYVIRMGYQ